MTVYGIIASLAVVGLVLTFLVSLAYLLGTLFRRPLLAIVVVLFIWYPSNLILSTFSLEAFSTLSLSQALPKLFRTPWRAETDAGGGPRSWGLQDLRPGHGAVPERLRRRGAAAGEARGSSNGVGTRTSRCCA